MSPSTASAIEEKWIQNIFLLSFLFFTFSRKKKNYWCFPSFFFSFFFLRVTSHVLHISITTEQLPQLIFSCIWRSVCNMENIWRRCNMLVVFAIYHTIAVQWRIGVVFGVFGWFWTFFNSWHLHILMFWKIYGQLFSEKRTMIQILHCQSTINRKNKWIEYVTNKKQKKIDATYQPWALVNWTSPVSGLL